MHRHIWVYKDTTNDQEERFFYKEEDAFAHLRSRFLEKASPQYVKDNYDSNGPSLIYSELDEVCEWMAKIYDEKLVDIVKQSGNITGSYGSIFSVKTTPIS